MSVRTILFVCIHNSARSQMAEAFANSLAGDRFAAFSAGLEEGKLNPMVVTVMSELGIDISGNATKTVAAPGICDRSFDFVVTVCDESSAQACPVFPGGGRRLHWSFPDPSALAGSYDERLAATRRIRDDIRAQVARWLAEVPAGS